MPVFRYHEVPSTRPSAMAERRLAHTEHMMMVIADLSGGPRPGDPPHRHPHEQISYIAEGSINFILGEGEEKEVTRLEAGDMFIAPSNVPHTVELLSKTARLIECFHPIREEFLKK